MVLAVPLHSISSEISNVIIRYCSASKLPDCFALLEGSHAVGDTSAPLTVCLLAHSHVEISFLTNAIVQPIHVIFYGPCQFLQLFQVMAHLLLLLKLIV